MTFFSLEKLSSVAGYSTQVPPRSSAPQISKVAASNVTGDTCSSTEVSGPAVRKAGFEHQPSDTHGAEDGNSFGRACRAGCEIDVGDRLTASAGAVGLTIDWTPSRERSTCTARRVRRQVRRTRYSFAPAKRPNCS